jgi:hypothetical protein
MFGIPGTPPGMLGIPCTPPWILGIPGTPPGMLGILGPRPGTLVAPNIESVKALNSSGVRPASVFCTTANVTSPFTNNATKNY